MGLRRARRVTEALVTRRCERCGAALEAAGTAGEVRELYRPKSVWRLPEGRRTGACPECGAVVEIDARCVEMACA